MKHLIFIILSLSVISCDPHLENGEWVLKDMGRIQYKSFYIHKVQLKTDGFNPEYLYFMEDENGNPVTSITRNYTVSTGKSSHTETSGIINTPPPEKEFYESNLR